MEKRIALFFTYLFHPIIVPIYTLILILHLNIMSVYILSDHIRWLIIGMMSIATVALPVLIMILLIRRGRIMSYRLSQREERVYPYVMMTVVYYTMYLMLSSVAVPDVIRSFLLGVTIILVAGLLTNIRWKISIHMLGMGGLCGSLTGISLQYTTNLSLFILSAIIIAGIVGFARLKLEAHKPAEVYSGYITGFLAMVLVYVLL